MRISQSGMMESLEETGIASIPSSDVDKIRISEQFVFDKIEIGVEVQSQITKAQFTDQKGSYYLGQIPEQNAIHNKRYTKSLIMWIGPIEGKRKLDNSGKIARIHLRRSCSDLGRR